MEVYHEKQDAGLCAVHCLNALLQGPYFTEVDLMTIAREFDEQERSLMAEQGISSSNYLRFMAEDSGNVADDGNYSVQVLQHALRVWNVSIVPLNSPDGITAKQHPENEEAFICNLLSHWFTIRKVGDHFFNFNSLLPKPTYLKEFYLKLYLASIAEEGYTIFIARGLFPPVDQGRAIDETNKNWKIVYPQIESSSTTPSVHRQTQGNESNDDSLQAALEQSRRDHEDAMLAMAIAASTQQDQQSTVSFADTKKEICEENEDDEAALQQALLMSMQNVDDEEKQSAKRKRSGELKANDRLESNDRFACGDEVPAGERTRVAISLPDNGRLIETFDRRRSVMDVFRYLNQTLAYSPKTHEIMSAGPPPKLIEDLSLSFVESDLVPNARVIVRKKA